MKDRYYAKTGLDAKKHAVKVIDEKEWQKMADIKKTGKTNGKLKGKGRLIIARAKTKNVEAKKNKTKKKTNAKSAKPTGLYTFSIFGHGYHWSAESIPPKAYKFWNNNKEHLEAYFRSDDRAEFLSNLGASPDAHFYDRPEEEWRQTAADALEGVGDSLGGPIFGYGKNTLEVEGSKPEETYSFPLEPKALKALGINVVKDEPWVSGPAVVSEGHLNGSCWDCHDVELPTPFDPHKLEITYRNLANEIGDECIVSSITYAGESVDLPGVSSDEDYSFYLLPPKGVKKPGSLKPISSE